MRKKNRRRWWRRMKTRLHNFAALQQLYLCLSLHCKFSPILKLKNEHLMKFYETACQGWLGKQLNSSLHGKPLNTSPWRGGHLDGAEGAISTKQNTCLYWAFNEAIICVCVSREKSLYYEFWMALEWSITNKSVSFNIACKTALTHHKDHSGWPTQDVARSQSLAWAAKATPQGRSLRAFKLRLTKVLSTQCTQFLFKFWWYASPAK